jgi:hypothetical protein
MLTALCISVALNAIFIGIFAWLLFFEHDEKETDIFADPDPDKR